MPSRRLAVIPAAIIPAVVLVSQRAHAPDLAAGLMVGALAGLPIALVIAQRRRC